MSFNGANSSSPEYQTGEKRESPAVRNFSTVKISLPANRASVTHAILGITIFIYLLQFASQSLSPNGYDYPALLGMKINELILAGEIWRLFTPMLLHASIPHILFNMYALYAFGVGLERYYGHRRFLILYILGGFAGNVCSFLFSNEPSLGASTAIFGLVAAEAIFIFRNRFFFGKRAGPMLLNTLFIVVINLILGLSPGIDNWGHLGGLIGGLAFAWFAGPIFKVDNSSFELIIADERNVAQLWKVTMIEFFGISLMALMKFFLPGI
jgi:rhomboid protease GluP